MNTNNTPSWEDDIEHLRIADAEGVRAGTFEELKSFIKEHFIPREKVREVVEGMMTPIAFGYEGSVVMHEKQIKDAALTDVLQALLDEKV